MNNDMSKQMETDPAAAMDKGGSYSDAVAEETNVEGKLATANMPKASDPSPFAMGPLTTGQR